MLQSDAFSEGQSLSSNFVTEIPLPEDDPRAMEIICHATHQKTTAIPRDADATTLLTVATHVDKYFLHDALGYALDTWINARLLSGDDTNDQLKTLSASILLRRKEVFKHITKSFVYNYEQSFVIVVANDSSPYMGKIACALEAERSSIRSNLMSELQLVLNSWTTCHCGEWERYARMVILEMRKRNFSVHSIHARSLSTCIDLLRSVITSGQPHRQKCRSVLCEHRNSHDSLDNAIIDAQRFRGLALDDYVSTYSGL